jgi:hypothetical protein
VKQNHNKRTLAHMKQYIFLKNQGKNLKKGVEMQGGRGM